MSNTKITYMDIVNDFNHRGEIFEGTHSLLNFVSKYYSEVMNAFSNLLNRISIGEYIDSDLYKSLETNKYLYALEVYEKDGNFVRQIDVYEKPEMCTEIAARIPYECSDKEEFHITEIAYEVLEDGKIGKELEFSTNVMVL